MELREEQYERIARWLDGETVELSAEELTAAREVRGGEAGLWAALPEVAVPAGVMARAHRELRAAAARPLAVRGRFVGMAAAGAAVAAAILVAFALRNPRPPNPAQSSLATEQAPVPVEVWMAAWEEPAAGAAIHRLAGELDQFEADLAASRPPPALDRQIDSVQQDIDTFWQDESPVEMPDI